ncbi:MAG: acetyl-CoA carboxylase biotin carboxyl carrier protein subunit [Bacteroidales bacterium]|jgi:biotin carboxyl carrier protein|nr:acetyl-CoA carboxylase biotin carboxyl carrier protein subunit [Bacteroidales bacterium]
MIAIKPKDKKFIACVGKKKYEFLNPKDLIIKDGRDKEAVEIVSDKNGFVFITWKGRKYQVEITDKNQNQYEISVNGVSYSISVESPFSFKRKRYLDKNKVDSKIEQIQAPMPGKIIELLVEENQVIKAGEPLLILEAMKMQNEILSNIDGKIKSIHFAPEDTVMKDDVLIEVEK